MSPRNTKTGGVLEAMILPALDQGGYTYKVQVLLGRRLDCGRHYVDVVAEKEGRKNPHFCEVAASFGHR